ncbi:MAG: DUF4388 domain-containing protein [Myxococcota bacterium]
MRGTILIADADVVRGSGVAKACELRGLRTRQTVTGPSALELALADVPDLVVAGHALPMIESPRLAEILRSNPRTQAVPFLFLGPATHPSEQSAFDETLPLGADPEDVALRVEAMLTRRSRVEAVARGAGEDHEISGKLAQVSLADVLQLLHLNQRSGSLDVTRRIAAGREERGRILLREGNAIQAEAGAVEGEKALFRLLGWSEGSFAFSPGAIQVAPRITAPTRALLLEGARHLDEWSRARTQLPGLEAQVRLRVSSGELPNVVQPLTQEVLLLLEIYSRVGDVVDHCTYPDYQVLRTLHTLIEREIVELRQGPERSPEGPSLFSVPQVRRLHEWLRNEGARGQGFGEAKLLLLASSENATREFLRRLEKLPGVEAPPRPERRIPAGEDFAPAARIAVSDEAALEVLHVPAGPAYAPLWKLAAHRALGAVLVLDGTGAAARALLDGCGRVLGAPPRARIFHAVLQDAEQSGDPRRLREALELDESASLVVLPPTGGEVAEAALRGLLASVVP